MPSESELLKFNFEDEQLAEFFNEAHLKRNSSII